MAGILKHVTMGWLQSIILSHAIGKHVAAARTNSRLALACEIKSSEPLDVWDQAAYAHRRRQEYQMDWARALAERPRKPLVTYKGVPVYFGQRMR